VHAIVAIRGATSVRSSTGTTVDASNTGPKYATAIAGPHDASANSSTNGSDFTCTLGGTHGLASDTPHGCQHHRGDDSMVYEVVPNPELGRGRVPCFRICANLQRESLQRSR